MKDSSTLFHLYWFMDIQRWKIVAVKMVPIWFANKRNFNGNVDWTLRGFNHKLYQHCFEHNTKIIRRISLASSILSLAMAVGGRGTVHEKINRKISLYTYAVTTLEVVRMVWRKFVALQTKKNLCEKEYRKHAFNADFVCRKFVYYTK